MQIQYKWSMPSIWTFEMHPIRDFIFKYLKKAKRVLVPFAGKTRFGELDTQFKTFDITYIDLNEYPNIIHGDAFEVLPTLQPGYDLIISDPPYTAFQAVHRYGNEKLQEITVLKREYDRLLLPNGIVIHCGFNSTGIGKKYGYSKEELLIVNCGGSHNDFLVLAERKMQRSITEFYTKE